MSKVAFTLPSFAKINWRLRVLGRRTDGYHELRTILQTITLRDQLTFETREDDELRLTSDSHDLPVDGHNLILRAADAFRKDRGIHRGASIHLEKLIPVEGGLGGGSSNAAMTLLGLACLWDREASIEEIHKLAAGLGADVPFFLTGGTALGTGLGADISPMLDVSADYLAVVTPKARVSTVEAYKALNSPALTKADSAFILSISRADEQFTDPSPDALHNDFEPVVFRANPEIKRVKEALLNAGARSALLAGSGSSVFGVFESCEARERAIEILNEESEWRIFPCSTISRPSYLAALGTCATPLRARQ